MKVIVCVDNQYGIQFNHRRVSSDIMIIEDMIKLTNHQSLWIEPYSTDLFQNEYYDNISIISLLPNEKLTGYQFVETSSLIHKKIQTLIIYYFNRNYPSDLKLAVDLDNYTISSVKKFKGHSHDLITRVIYQYNNE